MNPHDTAPTTALGNAGGIRAAYVEITFPGGFDRFGPAADPDGAIPASAMPAEPVMLAYAWARIEDGLGIGYTFSDLRLLRGEPGWSLALPADTKRPKCIHNVGGKTCNGRNHPRANYCNWCGGPLKPEPEPRYHEFVRCMNEASYKLLLDAVLAAYRVAYTGRRARVWRKGDPLPSTPAGSTN